MQAASDEAMMECTKQTSLTDRQRLTALCSETVANCYNPIFEAKFKALYGGQYPTEDETKQWIQSMNSTWVRLIQIQIKINPF